MKNTTLALSLLLGLAFLSSGAQADVIDFLFGAGKFGRNAGVTADCRNVFQRIADNRRFVKDETWKTRIVSERAPRYLNDLDYLEENKFANALLGSVNTKFIKEFDTRSYHTTTAKPRPDGTVPMVDPEAKALVIYFHGSGTEKASGATFSGKMNALAKLGYSSLSFDLPFHQDGSRNPALANSKEFADYVHKIIESVRVPGQRIILAGHSFGPDIISEYITRYPHSVDSAVLISPANLDKVSQKWYDEVTSRMDFGDTKENKEGGAWAGRVTIGSTWNDPKAFGRVDPTVANPKLKVHVISGDKEEYFPGELGPDGKPTSKPRDYDVAAAYRPLFKYAQVTIEPGVGHYIFAHQDAKGQDVVLRSILHANGESLLDEKEIKKAVSQKLNATRTPIDQMVVRYSREIFFREWLDMEARKQGMSGQELLAKFMREDDKKSVQKLAQAFQTVEKQRTDAMIVNIKNTANWAPQFYSENKALIDQLGNKGFDSLQIQTKYLNFLKTQSEEVISKHAVVDSAVYVVPEKPVPQGGPRPEHQQGSDRRPRQQMADGPTTRQQGDEVSPTQMGVTPSPAQMGDQNSVRQLGDRSSQRQIGDGGQRTRQPGDQSSRLRQQGDSGQVIRQQGERQRSPGQQGDQLPSVPQFEGGPRRPQQGGFPSAPQQQQQGFFPMRHFNQTLNAVHV